MTESGILYAHTPEEGDERDWQTLEEHLNNVADRAQLFASAFGAGNWGYALGALHDAGKAKESFQRRLRGSCERVDHATFGAKRAAFLYNKVPTAGVGGTLMAFAIAGHHGGMPDGLLSDRGPSLKARLAAEPDELQGFGGLVRRREIVLPDAASLERLPWSDKSAVFQDVQTFQRYGRFSTVLFARMIFSALVDADYLDTEEYVQPEIAGERGHRYASIGELLAMLERHMASLESVAPGTPVNRARASILEDSRTAAQLSPGIFTMTTPTGGGKTLASMMFALRHAVLHGMDRVIVAIPFTSIVEQTASVLKEIFGRENVLEHHSGYDFEADSGKTALRERLAVQNWDAPIIVTTNVQLLESLYANRPGKCRKLHNVARSVIVLDEAQTIPDELLMPSIAALEDLALDYGCSVVMCTATQPAVDDLWPFGSRPRPIVRHTEGFDTAFAARAEFVVRGGVIEDDLVEELAGVRQALCVVGTKAKARRLYEEIGKQGDGDVPHGGGVFHLSANMIPAHRSRVIEEIRRRLDVGERCVVVSTQLVEAGVDVDFPIVYRELAGIDSLFQAAGRCNRNGRLRAADGRPVPGKVHVFELTDGEGNPDSQDFVSGWLGKMRSIARTIIREHGNTLDSSMVREFFVRRYHTGDLWENLDGTGLYRELVSPALAQGGFRGLAFRKYADEFKIIRDDTEPIFVPWEAEGRRLYAELVRAENPATMAMRLQRYSVSVYPHIKSQLQTAGALESYGPITVLRMDDDCRSFYSEETGLLLPGEEELNNMIV